MCGPRSALLVLSAIWLGSTGCKRGARPEPRPEPESAPPHRTPAALTIMTESLPTAFVGVHYRQPVLAGGGNGVGRTWRLVSGELPPGLELDGGSSCLEWRGMIPVGSIDLGLGEGRLAEVSGLAASQRNPGVLWVQDDGGRPEVYAITTAGNHLLTVAIDVALEDAEDLALGPGPNHGGDYVYIADTGDNERQRPWVQITRFEEPAVGHGSPAPVWVDAEAIRLVYPDDAADSEALLVSWDTATAYVVTKDDKGGRVYRVPVPLDGPWTAREEPYVLEEVRLPRHLPPRITSGEVSRDGARVVLRSYDQGWELVRPVGCLFEDILAEPPCPVPMPTNQQYESIGWSEDGTSLYTMTELSGMREAPIYRIDAEPDQSPPMVMGTPLVAGRWTVGIEVSDTAGNRVSRTLEIEILPPEAAIP